MDEGYLQPVAMQAGSDGSVAHGRQNLVITGGLGAIGSHVIDSRGGGARGTRGGGGNRKDMTVVQSRSGRTATGVLQRHGGFITVVKGSVASAADVAFLYQTTAARRGVSGVMHASGVLSDALLDKQTAGTVRAVFASKAGAYTRPLFSST